MKNNSLVIMAGGASSRMKRSLKDSNLPEEVLQAAKNLHKSLIPIGEQGKPLLYHLLKNAVAAGIANVYLITSEENGAFKDFLAANQADFEGLSVKFAIQYVPADREKPLGTADALEQCINQHPNLLGEQFTVCNGDNLYNTEAFKDLSAAREVPNALIAYDGESLGYTQERLAKFALLDFEANQVLVDILEKPTTEELEAYKAKHQKLWVSMNIFNFQGDKIMPFLEQCPLHPTRQEKELPVAVRNMVSAVDQSMASLPRFEKIPDLTSAEDIASFFN